MRPSACTIDTSCVIALDYLGILHQLTSLYSRVLLPAAVRKELFRRRTAKDRLRKIMTTYSFIEKCDDYEKGAVDILLGERAREGLKDRGEAETVVQAVECGADVLIDDRWGRDLALLHGREVHGTLWVLRRFFELNFASGAVTRERLVILLARGFDSRSMR